MEVESLVASAANHLGILDSYAFLRRRLTKSEVAILLYHRICHRKDSHYQDILMSPESFEGQMKYLSQNYEILSLDNLVDLIQSAKPFPEKAAVVTFDDGYRDNYVYAYPILQKYHVPATIFLSTGYVGTGKVFWWDKVGYALRYTSIRQLDLNDFGIHLPTFELEGSRDGLVTTIVEMLKRMPEDRKGFLIKKLLEICQVEIPRDLGRGLMLSWREVKEMHSEGVAFGAHSVDHSILTNIPLEQARNDITQSKNDIEKELGREITAFSYPNGDFNTEIVELVRKTGFTCAVSVGVGKLIGSGDNVYRLNRICSHEDFNKFKIMLCGLWGDLNFPLTRK